jgi:hypothetical protein
MSIATALLSELEQESQTTRRVLERVPQAHLAWKPHPKSMSLGQLALHIAIAPGNVAELVARDSVEPPKGIYPEASSTAELVPALDASIAKAKQHLSGMDDNAMSATWRMTSGGRDVMAMPRAVSRGDHAQPPVSPSRQLLVYLRRSTSRCRLLYGPTGRSIRAVIPRATVV